jgi:hypothetical protein
MQWRLLDRADIRCPNSRSPATKLPPNMRKGESCPVCKQRWDPVRRGDQADHAPRDSRRSVRQRTLRTTRMPAYRLAAPIGPIPDQAAHRWPAGPSFGA